MRLPHPMARSRAEYERLAGFPSPCARVTDTHMPKLLPTLRLAALVTAVLSALPAVAQNREILGEFRIGIIGRDRENPIYQAVWHGAREAAREMADKYSIDVDVRLLTPETAKKGGQPAALAKLFVEKADGFLISPDPRDAKALRESLRFATRHGQQIVFIESRIEGVDPLVSLLANETEAGRLAAEAILPRLQTGARVAILTTENPTDALEQRLEGARSVLGFRRIQTVVRCQPNYASAVQAIRQAHAADRNGRIEGWVFLGEWPLAGMPAYPWAPGDLPCVAIQATPTAFLHFERNHVEALVAHPYHMWGRRGVEVLVEKLFNENSPEQPRFTAEPKIIDFRNIAAYREKWREWLN